MSTYDDAMALLDELEALEKRVLPLIDPLMADVITGGFDSVKTVLSTTFNAARLSPDAIDEAGRTALDVKFGK